MIPEWLHILALVSLTLAGVCTLWLTVEIVRHPQKMWIMNGVWPVTAMYAGPLAVWFYFAYGRSSAKEAPPRGNADAAAESESNPKRKAELKTAKPFWAITALGVTHCGAGCTLGDIIAECGLFFSGTLIVGSQVGTFFIGDYVMAYLLGIAFQYFTIAPMRGISGFKGIWAAMKADTLSLTAFEVGLFAWMFAIDTLFKSRLHPDVGTYWFRCSSGCCSALQRPTL